MGKKNARICHTVNNANNWLFFLPFLFIWHNYVTSFFFIVYVVGPSYQVQKIFRRYCLVWCFGYILCSLSTLGKLLLLVIHIMITFWLTGANRNQQVLRFTSIITIGVMSILIVQVFSFIRVIFSFITEVVALGVGYIINPFLVAAELKDTEGVWASKGHLLKPQIEKK